MKDSKHGQTPIEDLADLKSYFSTHNVVREYISHSSKVHSVGWSCDGRKLASGSFDKSVVIFTLERNRLVSLRSFATTLLIPTFLYRPDLKLVDYSGFSPLYTLSNKLQCPG